MSEVLKWLYDSRIDQLISNKRTKLMEFLKRLFGRSEKSRGEATKKTDMPQIAADKAPEKVKMPQIAAKPKKSELTTSTDWGNLSIHGVFQKLRELGVRAEVIDEIEKADFEVLMMFPGLFPIEKLASLEKKVHAGNQEVLLWFESQLIAFLSTATLKATGQMPDLRHLTK